MAPEAKYVEHLSVLVHGFWGRREHLRHIRDTLAAEYPKPDLYILVVKSNESNNTYDGVDVGGERVAHEIENKAAELERQGAKLKKFSITGYSLGGLVSRYAIGLLYRNGFFKKYKPVNFTTFVSPHVGIKAPSFWTFIGCKTLGLSGQQIFLVDNFRGTGRPLLTIMADNNDIFIKGLARFKHKTTFANIINDRSVPYWSASFSRTDPYLDINKVKIHYLPGQEKGKEVILDITKIPEPQRSLREDMTAYQRWTSLPPRTFENIHTYLTVSVMILLLPLFLVYAAYQTILSQSRVKHHESGKAFHLERYRTHLLEDTDTPHDHMTGQGLALSAPHSLPSQLATSELTSSVRAGQLWAQPQGAVKSQEHDQQNDSWPILALNKDQLDIINSLDKVGITKFACYIRRVRHTHAAIIVRSPRSSFKEGEFVVAFWAKQFEV